MKIGINGFGRIGRMFTRELFANPEYRKNLEIVAVNDLTSPAQLAHSFKYDSNHGRFKGTVAHDENSITLDGHKITITKVKDPAELPWKAMGVDVVIESTGFFTEKEKCAGHFKAGAKKVIVSAPAKGQDITVVMGVNDDKYDPSKHHLMSNASCTTNCLAPLVSTLHAKFTVKHGCMTTIHSYTNDQRVLDAIHSDPRRARNAATNMIPTTTGAAKAVGEVIPELKGKLDGMSVRVPTPNVSLTDFVCEVATPVSKQEVNNALIEASKGRLKGILDCSDEPLVSSDYNGNKFSSIVDLACTNVIPTQADGKGTMVKVYSWYDNETGFSCRMLDLCMLIKKKGL